MEREQIIEKYKNYRSLDPFPEIAPALLNSADIFDYIEAIGMVWPFEEKMLNGVTLSLRVGEIAVYWDAKNEKHETEKKHIKIEKEFTLKSNSIAYVQIKEELRLPAYIIARFNLRVTNAYRGILLGTGPIVDPGFVGKLFIPLHNLTNNDYIFAADEPLIEMEFTKLSPNANWTIEIPEEEKIVRKGSYKNWSPTFDQVKTDQRDIEYYLRRANQGHSIQSSLPPLVQKVDESVKKVEIVSDKVTSNLRSYNLSIILSFAALLGVMATIINILRVDIREIRDKKYDEKINLLIDQNNQRVFQIDSLKNVITNIPQPISVPVKPKTAPDKKHGE